MKKYVFFCYINGEGGGQFYVDSKVRYLEKTGWEPIVFYPAFSFIRKNPTIPWSSLKKFKDNARYELFYRPEYLFSYKVKNTLKWMETVINPNGDEIIIESPTDHFAEWGELLAERLNAKHLCFLLDERLETSIAKDFLYYKYEHHEIAGIHKTSMKRLFSGYRDIPSDNNYVLVAANDGAVADIHCEKVDMIERLDYNIAYIGRNKQYCENIVKGIYVFANKYCEKKINFIILGEIIDLELLQNVKNVKISKLGFMHPIPRILFKKLDLVIAGAGCAGQSASQNVPTIVADASRCLSAGILGYTTFDTLFNDNSTFFNSFDVEIENVLVRDILKGKDFNYRSKNNINELFNNHLKYIKKFDMSKGYYNFKKQYSNKKFFIIKFIYPCLIFRDRFKWKKYKNKGE